ncbi:MAG: hypothetical protein HQK62_12395 [Desulfamplus sp.]|nr:hypothetical protein [Desulfamplus sp.]
MKNNSHSKQFLSFMNRFFCVIFIIFYSGRVYPDTSILYDQTASWEFIPSSAQVNCFMLSAKEDILWIGTMGGLEKRDALTGNFLTLFTTMNGLPNNQVRSLALDGDGGIWVGTEFGGIAHYKTNGTWEVFTTKNSDLPDNSIHEIITDSRGGIWIASGICGSGGEGGLIHLNKDGTWGHKISTGINSIYDCTEALLLDEEGGIWFGAKSYVGHIDLNGDLDIFEKVIDDFESASISDLESDGMGGVWVATHSNGIYYRKPNGVWLHFDQNNSGIPYNNVWQLLYDHKNLGIWVGTLNGLAYRNSKGSWTYPHPSNAEFPKFITSIISDDADGLWMGSEDYFIHRSSAGNDRLFSLKNRTLPTSSITTLANDGRGGFKCNFFILYSP